METFSLLKYWRGGGAANVRTTTTTTTTDNLASANMHTTTTSTNPVPANMHTTTTTTTTTKIATSVLRPSTESDNDDDEGSFFDLEFTVRNDDGNEVINDEDSASESSEEAEDQGEVNFAVSSSLSPSSSSDPSISLSPSDDLFFKGQLVPLEPSSIVITTSSDSDPKSHQFPVSLLKSATKFRVFMLGLKKPKPPQSESNAATSPKQNQLQNNKFFIKFKVEEVPIVSLFTRESSSSKKSSKSPRSEEEPVISAAEEKKFSKETVQKYISKIKPLYVRVSKRYGEKLKFSGQLTAEGAAITVGGGDDSSGEAAPVAAAKVKLPTGFRVVRKRLGKSKSASSAVIAAVASPPGAQQRRDDSLLQQQDGIQSAIAHCKRSLNATSKGSQSPLVRSKSDPTDNRSEKGNGDCCA